VGSQKSSGFQLYCKNTNDCNTPYTLLSSGFLSPSDTGLLFYPSDIDPEKIPAPANFLKRYIKVWIGHLTTFAHVLRITICKTEKSVPALGKIEVWGTVSPRCGKDIVANVYTLWSKHEAVLPLPITEYKTEITSAKTTDNRFVYIYNILHISLLQAKNIFHIIYLDKRIKQSSKFLRVS